MHQRYIVRAIGPTSPHDKVQGHAPDGRPSTIDLLGEQRYQSSQSTAMSTGQRGARVQDRVEAEPPPGGGEGQGEVDQCEHNIRPIPLMRDGGEAEPEVHTLHEAEDSPEPGQHPEDQQEHRQCLAEPNQPAERAEIRRDHTGEEVLVEAVLRVSDLLADPVTEPAIAIPDTLAGVAPEAWGGGSKASG